MTMTREEYEAKIDEKLKAVKQELMSEFKEEPSIDGWKDGDTYYYVNTNGNIIEVKFYRDNSEAMYRATHRNAFRTYEEAKFKRERDAVIHELSRFAEPKDEVWDGKSNHFYICYSMIENKMSVNYNWINKRDDIYFASREDAEKAIKEVGEERIKKYYLGVEHEDIC